MKDALTKAACAISGFACSNQLIVDGVVERVVGDGANDDNVMGTPNEGPRGVTVTGTPDTGEKGPTVIGTPDQGERGATIISTPDNGKKGPIITATPNEGPLVFDPMLNADASTRPIHRQSEIDVGKDLPSGARDQVSFKDGKEVPHGTAGSVRPDWCNGTICSVEVKNYNIDKNKWGLIDNASKQAIQRHKNLPDGMQQQIVIDVRGQKVTPQQELSIRI